MFVSIQNSNMDNTEIYNSNSDLKRAVKKRNCNLKSEASKLLSRAESPP